MGVLPVAIYLASEARYEERRCEKVAHVGW